VLELWTDNQKYHKFSIIVYRDVCCNLSALWNPLRDALYSFVCFKAMYILIIYELKLLSVIILCKEVTTKTAYYSVQFSIIISRNVKS